MITFSMFCHYNNLCSTYYDFDILHSIFCPFDILSFDIISRRYFLCLSIFCLFDILRSILCPFDNLRSIFCHSIFCPSIFCIVDILQFDVMRFDILRFRYLPTRYSATSIFCDFDILRLRYFAFDICVRHFAIFCFRYFVRNPYNTPKAEVQSGECYQYIVVSHFGYPTCPVVEYCLFQFCSALYTQRTFDIILFVRAAVKAGPSMIA